MKTRLLPLVLVWSVTCLAFLPSLHFGFLYWDDVKNLVTNPYIRQLDWPSLRWMATTHFQGPYQPLSWLSLALDFRLWGLHPAGFHATNLLLHSMNAVLAYTVLRLVFKMPGRAWPAAAGALFFALHPLRVESVAWVTERRDVLSGFFFLLALIAYVQRWTSGSLLAFVFALSAKATAVGLVWLLIALDLTVLARLPGDPREWGTVAARQVWKEKLPYLGIALVFGVLNLVMYHDQGILQSRYGLADRTFLFLSNIAFYLQKTLWPHPLLPYYELPIQLAAIWERLAVYSAVTLAISALAWRLRRRWPAFWILWVTYAGMLFPLSGVAQNGQQIAADRYTYLATLPWAGVVTALLLRRPRFGLWAGGVLMLLFVGTRHQLHVWRTDETLWLYTARFAPRTYLAHSNLGTLYLRQGREREATAELRQAVALRPTDVEGRLNLGVLEERQKHWPEAEALYHEALALAPGNVQVLNNVALLHAKEGRLSDGIRELRHLVQTNPSFAEAQLNLGLLLRAQGESREGKMRIERALQLKPELATGAMRSKS